MKTITELRARLMKKEKGKQEVSVAQMSEILSILSDLYASGSAEAISTILFENGNRREKRRRETESKRRN